MYRIRVKNLRCCEREDVISLDVTSSTRIRHVKQEVEKQTNIDWKFQVLAHGNRKNLKNGATLASCGVHSDTTLTLHDNTPRDLPKDTEVENPQKRKDDGSSPGPPTKVPRTNSVFSQPQSPFSTFLGGFGFTNGPQSTPGHTPAPSPFSSMDPQPSSYNFGSFPWVFPAASNQPQGEEHSKRSSSNYSFPSVSGDINTDNDTMPPLSTPPLNSFSTSVLRSPSPRISGSAGLNATAVDDLRNPNQSTIESEISNSVFNERQSFDVNTSSAGSSVTAQMTPSPESSQETITMHPPTHNDLGPIFTPTGPGGTATTSFSNASKTTFNAKLEASCVLGLARANYDEALQAANSKSKDSMEGQKNTLSANLDKTRLDRKAMDCDIAISEAWKNCEEAWHKLSSVTPSLLTHGAITSQQELSRLLSLACTKHTEALESKRQIFHAMLNSRSKVASALQKETSAKKELEEAEKALHDAKQAFEEACMKLSSIKE